MRIVLMRNVGAGVLRPRWTQLIEVDTAAVLVSVEVDGRATYWAASIGVDVAAGN